MSQIPLFFENQERRLFAMLHEAQGSPGTARGGLVFCPAWAEEATISQRVCADAARALAQRGYHVLRMDYRGTGDSEGEFDQVTLGTCLSDVRAALNLLRQRIGQPVGLVGLRCGATLAALAAAGDAAVPALVLWEPVVNLPQYVGNFLRLQAMAENLTAGRTVTSREALAQRLEAGEAVDVLAYPMSPACYRDFIGYDLLKEAGGEHGPTLIVAISRQDTPRNDLQSLRKTYQARQQQADLLHVAEPPFWIDPNNLWREISFWSGHESLFEQSGRWLDARFKAKES